MALETATYIGGLVITNPTGLDPKSQGDDHIRLLKKTLKDTFTGINGEVTATHTEINSITDGTTAGRALMGLNYKGTNLLINTGLMINQRNALSSGTLAATTFVRDLWYGNSGTTYSIAATNTNTAVCTVTAGAIRYDVLSSILTGEALTLSWTGTALGSVNGGSSYAASPIVIPATASVSNIFLAFSAGSFSKVQLEKGSIATEYAYTDPVFDLHHCKRYYQTGVLRASVGANGSYAGLSQMLPVPMAVPLPATVTFTDNAGTASKLTSNGVHGIGVSSGTLSATQNSIIFDVLTTTPLTNWWSIQYTVEV